MRNWVDLTNIHWKVASCKCMKRCLNGFCLGFDHKKNFYNPLFVKFFLALPCVILILMFRLLSIASNAMRKKTCFLWPIQLYGTSWIGMNVVNDIILCLIFKVIFKIIYFVKYWLYILWNPCSARLFIYIF